MICVQLNARRLLCVLVADIIRSLITARAPVFLYGLMAMTTKGACINARIKSRFKILIATVLFLVYANKCLHDSAASDTEANQPAAAERETQNL